MQIDWEQGEVAGKKQNNETLHLLFSPFTCEAWIEPRTASHKGPKEKGGFWVLQHPAGKRSATWVPDWYVYLHVTVVVRWLLTIRKAVSILPVLQTILSPSSSLNGGCEGGRTENLSTFLIPYLATGTWNFS